MSRTTTVEVGLDEFDDGDLIDELVSRTLLSKEQGKALKLKSANLIEENFLKVDYFELDIALWRLRHGNKADTLHHLENAIPGLCGLASLFGIN